MDPCAVHQARTSSARAVLTDTVPVSSPLVSASPRSPRYLSLDQWRGIACLLVVVFHSTSVFAMTPRGGAVSTSGLDGLASAALAVGRIGWIGVPIFFVISGYAISAAADSSRRSGQGTPTYFRRRFRRIYPTYWAWILVQLAIVFALDVVLRPGMLTGSVAPVERPWEFTPIQWLGNLTLTESWRANVVPLGSPTDYLLGQTWTLCYEEQFYLVAGIVLIVRPQRFFSLALLVTAITLVVATVSANMNLPVRGFFFDGNWLMFAAGILVYWHLNYGSARTLVPALACLAIGLMYAMLLVTDVWQLNKYLFVGFVFAALILVLHRYDRTIARAATLHPLRFAGMICFSLYLSHAVIVRSLSIALRDAGLTSPTATLFVVLPACVALAVAVAWLLHVTVERRFLAPSTVPAPSDPLAPDGSAPVAIPGSWA